MPSGVCEAKRADGKPCGAKPLRGKRTCIAHSKFPDDVRRQRAGARLGGMSRALQLNLASPSLAPLANSDPALADLDLATPEGLRGYMAATLRHLGNLPFSERTANAIAQIATAQRALIETSDLEARLTALEAVQAAG